MDTREKFLFLYGNDEGHKIFDSYRTLIDRYKKRIKRESYEMSEKDIVLITYGDQLMDEGIPSLEVLNKFLKKYLRGFINSVHILPFYPYTSDDGFSVVDYKKVNPELGSWKDIENSEKDYRLMYDAVVNHISSKSPWFQGYVKGDTSFENFFISVDPETDLRSVVRPRNLPLLTLFETSRGKEWIWTTFSEDQIDLNYKNPQVLLAIVEVLLDYIAHGAKLIRLDAIALLWKEVGTPCIHLPETHAIVKLFRDMVDEVSPDVILVTETNVPHGENISYFGNGTDEAHMVYNFSLPPLLLHAIITGDASRLNSWASKLSLPSRQTYLFNFTASHDGIGVRPLMGLAGEDEIEKLVKISEERGGYVSFKANSDGSKSPYELNSTYFSILSPDEDPPERRLKRFMLSQAVMLAMPGIPGIYFHSLIGSENFVEGVKETGRYRTINREKLDLNKLARELKNPESLRSKVFNNYLGLIKVRTSEELFHPNVPFKFPEIHPVLFCVLKGADDGRGKLMLVHNVSGQRISAALPEEYGSSFKDIVSGAEKSGRALDVDPYEFLWLKMKK